MSSRLAATALLCALAACGGDAPPAPPQRQPTPLDPTTTGTITGEVRFEGTPPAMKEIRFGSFTECAAQHPEPVYTDDALVHDGRVQNAFVYIADGLGDRVFAVPEAPVAIDQRGCRYTPRVAGARVGQLITFVNSDPAVHNVHGTPAGAPGWNFVLSRRGAERQIRLAQPQVAVSVRCDLHPWMQAWIAVVDHPYFAVTGRDGTFRLAGVPPGTYTVTAWHERFGTRSVHVTLPERGSATATFTFSAS
ncbi:MAG TPA: carboxypeptidase regulatory-like domain-containing protein [Candidatus Limnocylindria bacterium]|nr:carboxypeptidase regulatory-like domain-containing protein [Candidatus Limnocylindria bacterium]